MAKITQEEMERFATILVNKIKEEFSVKKMSGNLANTIEVLVEKDKLQVIIPAQTYNMLLYQSKKVITHTGRGSYASKLDDVGSEFYVYPGETRKGSFLIKPHNHKDFVDKVINQALEEWLIEIGNKYGEAKVTKLGG